MGRNLGEIEEIVDEEDGPPPGFQSIITPQPLQQESQLEKTEAIDEDDVEEQGPPPGFHSINPKLPSSEVEVGGKQDGIDDGKDEPPPGWESSNFSQASPSNPPSSAADMEMKDKQDSFEDEDGPPPGWELSNPSQAIPSNETDVEMKGKQDRIEDDEDGPPSGWEFETLSRALPSNSAGIEIESKEVLNEDEDEDDGPPPGWETILPQQVSGSEMESKIQVIRNNEEGTPSRSQSITKPEQLSPPTLPQQLLPSSAPPTEMESKEFKSGGERPASERQSVPSPQPLKPVPIPSPPPVATSPSGLSTEKAQLVCGTCRKLLLYPRGAKWVQCPGCQEVNLVLEAHQVGQVNCGGCAVLLMYPHGAPAVQCSSCRFVTQIGAHNRRPPLSDQQAQRRRRFNRAR